MMHYDPDHRLSWRRVVARIGHAWMPLLTFELLMSLLVTAAVGPLLLVGVYQLLGISGETVWTNWDFARSLRSPWVLLICLLGFGATLGCQFVRYAGLILLADEALQGRPITGPHFLLKLTTAIPRLLGLALLCVLRALLTAIPFLAAAGFVFWWLLSDADINYYVSERPWQFWVAATAGALLAAGLAATLVWQFARWAFAVPACVSDKATWRTAMQSSASLMRGRTARVLLVLGGWQVLRSLVLLLTFAGLDQLNEVLLAQSDRRLSVLVWSTALLLLTDALLLELLTAWFTIGTAALIAREYELARLSQPDASPFDTAPRPPQRAASPHAWQSRAAVLALVAMGPVVSVGSTVMLAHELMEDRPTLVTAHRAGPKSAPENSLAALRLALAAGADFVEIDVQQTSDGHVVLLHDRDLRRVAGDARLLEQLSLADLQQVRLRSTGTATDERVPTLAEFLAACDPRIRLNIELKETSRHPQLAQAVVDVLRQHHFTARAGVSCFDLAPLLQVRSLEPEMPIGKIVTSAQGDLVRLPVNFLSLNQRLVGLDIVRRAHAHGMEVHVWTVNDRASALRLLELGCDNLITSDPVLMREVVDSYAALNDVERLLLRLRRWLRE